LCRKKTYYHAPVSLLLLENTHNHASGAVLPMERKDALIAAARTHGVAVHLDGARVHNAASPLGLPRRRSSPASTRCCFAFRRAGRPVGSLLCGTSAFIEKARVARKRLGAACARSACSRRPGGSRCGTTVARLADDHVRARRLAGALADPGLRIDPAASRRTSSSPTWIPRGAAGWLSLPAREGFSPERWAGPICGSSRTWTSTTPDRSRDRARLRGAPWL
jgi:threonine aldolase